MFAEEQEHSEHISECRCLRHVLADTLGSAERRSPPYPRKRFMLSNDEFVYIYSALLGLVVHLQQAELCEPKLPIWPL